VSETAVKRLPCCGFRRTGKAMRQVYQCWWICREISGFFPGSNILFYVLYTIVIYLLTLPRITLRINNKPAYVYPDKIIDSNKIHKKQYVHTCIYILRLYLHIRFIYKEKYTHIHGCIRLCKYLDGEPG
jgi:hypothetical protein